MPSRLVVIPTYNEASSAPILIERLFKNIADIAILIIDDNSPDQTRARCEELKTFYPSLFFISRANKMGLASAYISGFKWGIQHGYEKIIQMDGDLSHRVRDLHEMLALDGDLILGSRWIKGGRTENWPIGRRLLSRSANLYARFFLALGVRDLTSGFRIYKREILESIDLSAIQSEGYLFQIEMTRAVKRAGGKIIEAPITFRDRINGKSKLSKSIINEAARTIPWWGVKRLFRR
jgi:dolichol-phosphate mannosyltransferase